MADEKRRPLQATEQTGRGPGPEGWGPRVLRVLLFALVAAAAFAWLNRSTSPQDEPAYTQALRLIEEGRVERAEVGPEEIVLHVRSGPGAPPEPVAFRRLPRMDESPLVSRLVDADVDLRGLEESDTDLWLYGLLSIAPLLLILGFFWVGMARAQRGSLSFGKSQPKIHDESAKLQVTFDDVAGVDEARAEVEEIVRFLKEPAQYAQVGAQVPKGVLLMGPPGTGKTLLARAIAGEAGVPFFTITGSAFVEMFVGVGAARMRSLFEQAKQRAPCIVFIDEIDAIGKSRGGVNVAATHDEREQTLNQLLAELDGFEPNSGVVLMAATNRPEVLDPALVRAGRFDRQVVVDRPDLDGRLAILQVHAKRVLLADDVNLWTVARRTPGTVGADLARVVNEAALAAVRRGADEVAGRDFDEAVDRIQLGLERQGRVLGDKERERVAIHESGHALVALSCPHADPLHRVSIIPRSVGSLGVTLQLPEEDRKLATRAELTDRICVALGGRAAEEVMTGEISTGAENDLEVATALARRMVSRWGMSPAVGPVSIEQRGMRFLDAPELGGSRAVSEEVARLVDTEVQRIVTEQLARATRMLERRRPQLQAMQETLLDKETLDRAAIDAILRKVTEAEPTDRRAA